MRRALVALALPLVLVGCSTWAHMNPFGGSSTMLAKADRLTADGDYRSAVAAYDAYLAQYSDDSQAVRARRDAVASIMTNRDEIARLNQELARVRDELVKREGDLAKVRQEAEKLRADLERLKQIDLQLEKRK
jgi:multidrug efflux pump subunit AcrA (membrane-fusion protein)